MDLERRSVELRGTSAGSDASASGPGRIAGLAIVYDVRSELLEGSFLEVIRPGAIRLKEDMLVLAGHNPQHVLGRVTSGTARAWGDASGIRFEVDLPDTSYARDLIASMARGDVCQCSFAMKVIADEWYVDGATVIREVLLAEVPELSIVSMPAYRTTEAALSS